MDRYNGILPVIKEVGITSHDMINRLRRITGQKKIGHTGTLDPSASGLMLTCFGRATKLTQFLTDWDKTYRAEITLGMVSDTLDADGTIEMAGAVPDLADSDLAAIVSEFSGRITQQVPAYSAVKIAGRKLYSYTRKGVDIDRPSREVEISDLSILDYAKPVLTAEIRCSKGTYIRTLAADIGEKLGCGAYLSGLRRTAIGPYSDDKALPLGRVQELHDTEALETELLSIENILDFPVLNICAQAAKHIPNGGVPSAEDVISWHKEFGNGDLISMADEEGNILAIGKSKCDSSNLRAQVDENFFSYVRVLV